VRWTRRRFLAGTTAAACIGCSTDSTTGSTSVPEALGADDAALPELSDVPALSTSVEVGSLTELRAASAPTYVPEARAWLVVLTEQEAEALAATADESLVAGLEHGVLAEVSAPRVPGAVLRLVGVVRVHVPRVDVQPGR
jgi:hypothetical protein